jgi:hypothetical protein
MTVDEHAAAFLKKVRELGSPTAAFQAMSPKARGRLIFAMDATASRQETWDLATHLQASMFQAASGLEVKLVYFRGGVAVPKCAVAGRFGGKPTPVLERECRQSAWVSDPNRLSYLMRKITCASGYTQIGRVLELAREQAAAQSITALVFVGDAMEENPDTLRRIATEVGAPVFMFQEGDNAEVEQAFREIARAANGAYCRFDAGAADTLRQLLAAIAVFATGGVSALEAHITPSTALDAPARLLLTQLKK